MIGWGFIRRGLMYFDYEVMPKAWLFIGESPEAGSHNDVKKWDMIAANRHENSIATSSRIGGACVL
jgi:hypothetical protein